MLSRDAQGRAERVHSRLRASIGPLDRDFEIMLTIRDEGPADVVLDRLPHEPRDGEALSMRWTLSPAPGAGRGTLLRLALTAKLDVPRMLPLPRGVANDLARKFVEAAAARLGGAVG